MGLEESMTLLGWIAGGIGLAVGVWFFVAFLDWLGDIGSGFTAEQAREQTRRWLRQYQALQPPQSKPRRPGSTGVTP